MLLTLLPLLPAFVVAAEDTTDRSDMAPLDPMSKDLWAFWYDYTCPQGTYVTRFFGKSGTYINTLTAQCGRVWNLKQVSSRILARVPHPGAYRALELMAR